LNTLYVSRETIPVTSHNFKPSKIEEDVVILKAEYDTPSSLYDTPSGLYDTPSGLYNTPCGLYDTPNGLYDTPSGLSQEDRSCRQPNKTLEVSKESAS